MSEAHHDRPGSKRRVANKPKLERTWTPNNIRMLIALRRLLVEVHQTKRRDDIVPCHDR